MVEELVAEGMTLEQVVEFMVATWGYTMPEAWLQVNTALGMPGDVLDSVEDAEFEDDVDDDEEPLVAAAFDESKHPRYESGRREGGRFAPKDGTSTADAQAEAEDQAKLAQDAEVAVRPAGARLGPGPLEDEFVDVMGDSYKLGKMDDAELAIYADWADQVAIDFDNDPEYQGFAANARTVMEQRNADRVVFSQVQPGEVGNIERMNVNATNPVYTGTLDGKKVVVKPAGQLSATRLREHVEPGFDLEREAAAAHVGKLLREDTPTVAPNVLSYTEHEVPLLGRSGVTPFVNGQTVALLSSSDPKAVGAVIAPDIRKIRLYDAVIGNTDRHEGNIMVSYPDSNVFPIDHGLAFPDENHEVYSNLQGGGMVSPLEDDERGALQRLRPRLHADTVLPTLLTEQQIQAMDDRIGFMLHNNRIINSDDWENGLVDDGQS